MAAFAILVMAAIGAPLPATLFLLVLGSFVAQGDLDFWFILLLTSVAAILGDQIGYGIGRLGGRRVLDALARRPRQAALIRQAEAFAARWGALGIFLSRWLVTALGPWMNITSGAASYPWPKFLLWDLLGEMVWVSTYVTLGRMFSDHIEYLQDLFINIGWLLMALLVAVISGRTLLRRLHHMP